MTSKIFSAVLIDDERLTLEQFCHTIYIDNDTAIEMVEHQLIAPEGKKPQEWRFDSECLRRAKIALNLQHDLEINFAGASLVLELLDHIATLEKRLKSL
ncbi:MAG: hypothetical protein A3F17_03680 [Gammaproteobacteria bacterium RIFCSPHIGHO2_12_FULL_41_15]|nr:MAG: hypothetical protein A3F17_03680 [Gammaproteobacteria bacterium RIFCSPHIGHO2_12_FULL_41_15]